MERLDCDRMFVAVLETGSFSRAAQALGTSSGQASKLVSKLEADLGVQLLNRTGLLANTDGRVWHGVPDGTVVGHLNLQVGDLLAAGDFYAGVLGFDITCRLPGASFFASGGYHHHIATNIWNSSGAPRRPDQVTGLADIEIIANDTAILDAVRSRVPSPRVVDDTPARLTVRDPWGTSISLATR